MEGFFKFENLIVGDFNKDKLFFFRLFEWYFLGLGFLRRVDMIFLIVILFLDFKFNIGYLFIDFE